jgi:hypothetical protein
LIGRILHQPERASVRIPPYGSRVEKTRTAGPSCDARHDATDIAYGEEWVWCWRLEEGQSEYSRQRVQDELWQLRREQLELLRALIPST